MSLLLLSFLLAFGSAPVYIAWGFKYLAGKTGISLSAITGICLLAAFLLPVASFFIDLLNIPPGIKCATGVGAIGMLGFVFSEALILVFATGFFLSAYFIQRNKPA